MGVAKGLIEMLQEAQIDYNLSENIYDTDEKGQKKEKADVFPTKKKDRN